MRYYQRHTNGLRLLYIGAALLLILMALASCYSARKQFAKAVTHSPELAATYCAITYPIKEKIIAGETVTLTDTLWSTEFTTDTVVRNNTVYVTKYLPGSTIRETVIRTDTIVKENTAAVEAERLNNKTLTGVLGDTTGERDKWRNIAKKRFWIIAGLGFAMALGIFLRIKKVI